MKPRKDDSGVSGKLAKGVAGNCGAVSPVSCMGGSSFGKTVKMSLSTGTSCGTRRFTGQLLHIDDRTSRNVGAKVRAGINNRRGDGRALGQSQADWQNKRKEAGKAAQVWKRSCGELCVHGFSESLSRHGLAVKITFFSFKS